MTLAQLRYLIAIVDAGLNITLAAERTNATQPGLSKQLKQLEGELGLRLFVRRGRSLDSLTETGRSIVARARTILTEANGIAAYAAEQRQGGSGLLSIATTHIQAQFVLPDALAALRRRFPDIDVRLGFGIEDGGGSDPAAGPDADFRMFSTDGRTPGRGIAIPLFHWDPVAIVPAGHPLATDRRAPTLERLAAFPLVTYDTSTTAPLSITRTFTDAGLSPRFAFTVRDGATTKAAVRSGAGVGIIAEMAIDPREAGLAVIDLGGLFPRCTTWAVLHRDRVLRDHTAFLLGQLSGLSTRAIKLIADGEADPRPPEQVRRWQADGPLAPPLVARPAA